MLKIIGLDITKNSDELKKEINEYIEKSEKAYLINSLLALVSDKNKSKVEKVNINDLEKFINKENKVTFIVSGNVINDYFFGKTLIKLLRKNKVDYELINNGGLVNLAYLNVDYDKDIEGLYFDELEKIRKDKEFVIHGIGNKEIAKVVSKKLYEFYKDDIEVTYLGGLKGKKYRNIKTIKISQLENEYSLDVSSMIYIKQQKRGFDDLVNIIRILRAPNGCPWDREQNHESIKRELVEECYEVLDAIDKKDLKAMEEEIGDVLLHVVFHGLIAEENNEFDLTDITEGICNKMIFRHPHIFGDEIAKTSKDVIENWDEIKKEEKGYKTITDEINGVAVGLPSLIRARKIQKKAAKVGFDFENVDEAIKSLEEEIKEFKDVYKSKNVTRIEDELGDVIFSTVNVGRLLSLDCEEVLEKSIEKFIKRFSAIERKAIENGQQLKDLNIDEMNELWERVKLEQK
ncbi:nucleoside triphosphate pyrophosphohydrolase [Clostridium sp.]|uniref:nucleoside triphosphate pyrophosphohydrolase n=1 Tax=Clostridium sp. TaxID=1506 RepID=UPI003991703F